MGSKKLSGSAKGYLILLSLVVVSWVIFKILTPHNFGSPANMLNYFQASLIATVGAVGFYFVMVMGMFDFSIGANIMLSAIVGCVFATRFNMGYLGLILGCVLTGTIVGLLNGLFYVKLRIPSMIVTTGLALIYESLANYIAGGVEQTLPSNLRAFGQMPWDIILAIVACIVAYIFLNYTKIGTYTYAIGSNEFVAKNMGINVNKYKVLAFVLSGAFLGVMAILTISYGSSMVAVTGMASMSRNFVPTMGCFFGLAFKKYGMPLQAIVIGEFVINIIFFGFIVTIVLMVAFMLMPASNSALIPIMVLMFALALVNVSMKGVQFSVIDEMGVDPKVNGMAIAVATLVGFNLPDVALHPIIGVILDKYEAVAAYKIVFGLLLGMLVLGFIVTMILMVMEKKAHKSPSPSKQS